MKIKEILLISLSVVSLIACSNNKINNEDRDAMQILEEKREYYEELDKKKEKEAKGYQVEMTAEEAKTEKEKIDNMLDIAKKARQEEIDVEETKNQVEEALKNITEEK